MDRNYTDDRITLLEAAVLIGRAIAGKEDFVYDPPNNNEFGPASCLYTHADGSAGCLIGQVLDLAGIERPTHASYGNAQTIDLIQQRNNFTGDAIAFLLEIQRHQDSHSSWGSSVEMTLAAWSKRDKSAV